MLRKRDFDGTTLGAIIDGRTPIKKGIFKWMKLNNELNLTIRNILMKDIYKKISHIYKKIDISSQWSLSIPLKMLEKLRCFQGLHLNCVAESFFRSIVLAGIPDTIHML